MASVLLEDDALHLSSLPRYRTRSKGPIKRPADFTEEEFLEQFRFRKEHFFEILSLLQRPNGGRFVDPNGAPALLRYGEEWHYGWVWGDQVLMIFLRRMATPMRWVDLQYILGGSRSKL